MMGQINSQSSSTVCTTLGEGTVSPIMTVYYACYFVYNNANVYSGDLVWIPLGNQLETLGNVKPLHDDILITKLRPG